MAAITICSYFGAQKIKSATVSPTICHEVMGPDAMILVFWMMSFKPTFKLFSLSSRGSLVLLPGKKPRKGEEKICLPYSAFSTFSRTTLLQLYPLTLASPILPSLLYHFNIFQICYSISYFKQKWTSHSF